MAHQITFKKQSQVILFEAELKGQISDGQWENATPHNHWEVICSAEAVQGSEPGLNFYPQRGYKFHDKDLYEAVGDRMIFYVRLYTAFPQLSLSDHHSFEFSEGPQELRQAATRSNYYAQKIEKLEAALGMSIEDAWIRIQLIDYTGKDCRSDLRQMSLLIREARK